MLKQTETWDPVAKKIDTTEIECEFA